MDFSLEEDYEALVQFLYMAPIGLVQARLDGEILMVNPLCAQLLLPLSRDGDLANLYTALGNVLPDLRWSVEHFEPDHGMVCNGLQVRVALNPADRRAVQHLSITVLKLDASRVMAVVGDVTQSVARERELRQNQAWLHTIVTGLTDYALMTVDERGCVQAWNPSIERVTGHTADSIANRPYSVFYAADATTADSIIDRLFEADRSGWSVDEGWLLRADGSRFWGSCLIAPLHAPLQAPPHGAPCTPAVPATPSTPSTPSTPALPAEPADEPRYSLIIRDVSDRRDATEAMRRAVHCDHLTGLANRRALFDAAEIELQRWQRTPRPLSLLLVDADHFKAINDQHGHAAGDAVLRHLAAGLSATFRAVDVVARLGGEEFVVLLPGASLDSAEAGALRLCGNIAGNSVQVGGVAIPYTVSVGLATMDASVDSVDTLIARADQAMYAAKAQGRNRVVRWQAGMAAADAAGAPGRPSSAGTAAA
jgi:diguanylate cyclase (GGDEF)-like protein/PAS domain S-box-containing protein